MKTARFVSLLLAAAIAVTAATASAQDSQTRAAPPATQTVQPLPRPWRIGDSAPGVEGIHLGDSEAQVVTVLGDPAQSSAGLDTARSALRTLRFRNGGLLVAVDDTGGVARIMLLKADGGSMAGVKVGDRLGHVVRLWGEPTAGGGATGKWPMGDWTVSVRGDMVTNVVQRIVLSRTPPVSAPPAAP